MNSVENRVQKIEEDDAATIAYRSINEAVASEDSNNAEKLSSLTEGFVLPESSGKHKYDKGVEKLVDQIVANMSKLWPTVNKNC